MVSSGGMIDEAPMKLLDYSGNHVPCDLVNRMNNIAYSTSGSYKNGINQDDASIELFHRMKAYSRER